MVSVRGIISRPGHPGSEGEGPDISTPRPRLRTATTGDAAGIQAIYAPAVRDTAISFELEPPDVDEVARRIEATLPRLPWIVAVDGDGGVLGYTYAAPHHPRAAYQWSVDVSVYVAADVRRQGWGRSLYQTLFEVLSRQHHVAAFAGIALPNPASVGLHRRTGFHAVGVYRSVGYKLGVWHDLAVWQRPLAPRPADPPDPRGFTEVWEAGELHDLLPPPG